MACLIDPSCASRAEAAGGEPQTSMSGVRAPADSPRRGESVPQLLPLLGAGTALRVEAAVPSSKSRSNLAAKLSLPEVTPVRGRLAARRPLHEDLLVVRGLRLSNRL